MQLLALLLVDLFTALITRSIEAVQICLVHEDEKKEKNKMKGEKLRRKGNGENRRKELNEKE